MTRKYDALILSFAEFLRRDPEKPWPRVREEIRRLQWLQRRMAA